MSNHPRSAPHDERHAVAPQLRERVRDVPPTPLEWAAFDCRAALRTHGASADARLVALQTLLCAAPARSAELRGLWAESLVTAAAGARIARDLGADAESVALAGILHRAGDMLVVRAMAGIEEERGARLGAVARAGLCAELGPEVLERALRAWSVPLRVIRTAAHWRELCDGPAGEPDAVGVNLGRLFAMELIAPQFCAPGAVSAAALEAGLSAECLSAVRADATIARLLDSLQ